MMATIFDDIAIVYHEFSEYAYRDDEPPAMGVDAAERLEILRHQFDALAPDWTQAPEWAQWCAVDANNRQFWCTKEPTVSDDGDWDTAFRQYFQHSLLPLGIDWRLCKWQRPVTP